MEVDYHGLRRDLRGELLKTGVDIGKPPMGNKGRYKFFERMSPSPAGGRTIIPCGLKSSSSPSTEWTGTRPAVWSGIVTSTADWPVHAV